MKRTVLLVPAVALLTTVLLAQPPAFSIPEHYTKYESSITMRDGKRLFTSIYVPKDASRSYPFLMTRTPYSVAPYGVDQFRTRLGPSEAFDRAGYIFVFQDVRGRYLSEGDFVEMRPHIDKPQSNTGRRREHRHLRHGRVAAEERGEQQRQGRHLGHLVSGLLHVGQHHRFASGHQSGVAAGADDRPLHGRRRVSQRRVHAGGEFQFLHCLQAAPAAGAAGARQPPFEWGTTDGYEFYQQVGRCAAPSRDSSKRATGSGRIRFATTPTTRTGRRATCRATCTTSTARCSSSADGSTPRISPGR